MKYNEYYWIGLLLGFTLGVLATGSTLIYLRDQGRKECNESLPRTQSCVQKWMPPTLKESKP